MRRAAFVILLWLAGCGHESAAPLSPVVPDRRGPSLRPDTPYAALAERVAALGEGQGASCLLAPDSADYRFVGDPAPAISPMPPADDAGLEAVLAAQRVRLVSRWGLDGSEGPFVASFTHHPPPSANGALVVLVRRAGASIRGTHESGPRGDGLSPGAVVDTLRRLETAPLVVVVAAAALRLDELRPYFEALDAASADVALGVALPGDVDVPPARVEPPQTRYGRCTSLAELPAGEPIGRLERDTVRAAMQPVREAFQRCASSSASRRVALGGRMRLSIRIDPAGRASDACMLEDSVDDEAFRRCVLEAVRASPWPPPSPAGYVDVETRLVLDPDERSRHAALCSPPEAVR